MPIVWNGSVTIGMWAECSAGTLCRFVQCERDHRTTMSDQARHHLVGVSLFLKLSIASESRLLRTSRTAEAPSFLGEFGDVLVLLLL